MEKQQKSQVKKVISWCLLVALVVLLAAMPLMAGQQQEEEGPQASILSAAPEMTDIETKLIGGGTLTGEDPAEITIPAAVKLTKYLVSNGDRVSEGTPIASVDRVTVMTAITQVQETLAYLAEEIEDISDETESTELTAHAGGTVKLLYAREGENVQDVMLRDGALAVLSLDGLMAVQVACDTALSGGETVTVTLSDGTEASGKVESNLDGILTVTVEDDDYPVGEEVTVADKDGKPIGSGQLYIHSRWNATAYSGTVKRIRVKEGDTVTAGKTLINLENTGHTARFYALSDQHREYEELMLTLFQMYQSETVTAPCDGVVSGVDKEAYLLSGGENGWTLTLLANAPNGDDKTSYSNFVGQVTAAGIDGLILKMNPQNLTITDYKDLSSVPVEPVFMTEEVIYTGSVPIYELSAGEWVQLDASSVAAGDILLFAGDEAGNFVWIVRIAKAAQEPETSKPTEPTTPTVPSEPGASEPQDPTAPTTPPEESTDPTEPTQPGISTQPGTSILPGITFPQGGYSGFGGGMVQEEEYELYALDTVTLACVTPQQEMTVEITVDELEISKIYLGQTAAITVNALAGQHFEGTVTAIGSTGTNEGGNSKFAVELTLERNADMLSGMNATVIFALGVEENVLSVPVAALTETETGTVLYTGYDVETGTLIDPVSVTVGVSDGENVQILSGISQGSTFYYAYYDTLEISNVPETDGFPFGR